LDAPHILLVYVDDLILMSPNIKELEYLVKWMKQKFEIKEEGDIGDYLGIQIQNNRMGVCT
jgi:hypothetical protein